MVSITSEATGAEERALPKMRYQLSAWLPQLVIIPSLVAAFVYVFGFAIWTFYISLSVSSLLPTYGFAGVALYADLCHNRRWSIAYIYLLLFSCFYVVLSLAVGLML